MQIWFSLAIPIITAIFLFAFFKRKTLWWEFLIPFVTSIFLIFICKLTSEFTATRSTEYLSYYILTVKYYEPWDELVTYFETHTDDKGNTYTDIHTRVDYHGPEWEADLSNQDKMSISNENYVKCRDAWKNAEKIDMHRDYHSIDGDMVQSHFSGGDSTLEPVVISHWYENRVQASNSVFKFEKVDPKNTFVYNYPSIEDNHMRAFLGECPNVDIANRLLEVANSKYGSDKQVRIMVLLFKDLPLSVGINQENYWKGGNKNEFVVCIGINSVGDITWCYPFSWTEREDLKVSVRDHILGREMKKLDAVAIVEWLIPEVVKKFERKHFRDFKYLSVEPSLTWLVVTFVLTLIVNIGVSFYVILNEFEEDSDNSKELRSFVFNRPRLDVNLYKMSSVIRRNRRR